MFQWRVTSNVFNLYISRYKIICLLGIMFIKKLYFLYLMQAECVMMLGPNLGVSPS